MRGGDDNNQGRRGKEKGRQEHGERFGEIAFSPFLLSP